MWVVIMYTYCDLLDVLNLLSAHFLFWVCIFYYHWRSFHLILTDIAIGNVGRLVSRLLYCRQMFKMFLNMTKLSNISRIPSLPIPSFRPFRLYGLLLSFI